MPTIDPAAHTGLLQVVLVLALLGVAASISDPVYLATAVCRWSGVRGLNAYMVELTERMQTGWPLRQRPLRGAGERCGDGCVWEPTRSR